MPQRKQTEPSMATRGAAPDRAVPFNGLKPFLRCAGGGTCALAAPLLCSRGARPECRSQILDGPGLDGARSGR
eukprot:241044-Pyramimonas_sp.AAC.1